MIWRRRRGLVADQEREAAARGGETAKLQDDMRALGKTCETGAQFIEATRVAGELSREQRRIDYLLGEMEGLSRLRVALRETRDTSDFQSAFDERDPLVTVCVATASRPVLLVERCLASILAQTYTNLQILVIGDHCIDETAERVAAIGDSRIEFHNLPLRGPYPSNPIDRWHVAGTAPLIAAQQRARGAFITYLDDDDRWEPDRVARMVKVAQGCRAEFVWHKFWFLQPDGSWALWGNGNLEAGQVGLQMVFYHRFFLQVPWDMELYLIPEPNDWNRLRKIRHLRPRMEFVDEPLTWYYKNYAVEPATVKAGEVYTAGHQAG